MLFNVQHADPQADPHDAIAAQLRDLTPRIPDEAATLSIAPTASPELPREPSFHATPLNDNVGDILEPPYRRGRLVLLLAAVCASVAVASAWHAYGNAAKQQLSVLIPQLRPAALVPAQTTPEPQNSTSQAAAHPPASETATQDASAGQAETAPAQATAGASAQPSLSPDIAQSIESMKQEIASLKQTVEQLQSGQQQIGRDIAKLNEQDARRKINAQATRPVPKPQRTLAPPVASYRTPAPYPQQVPAQTQTYSHASTQRETYVAPAAPAQLPPQPGDTSVPRPPMPLR